MITFSENFFFKFSFIVLFLFYTLFLKFYLFNLLLFFSCCVWNSFISLIGQFSHSFPAKFSFIFILFLYIITIFKPCHSIWINFINFALPTYIFFYFLPYFSSLLPPFSLFLTLDWVINHSVQLKELGAHSHALCDLERWAAFFSTWLALWQSSFTSALALWGQPLSSSHTRCAFCTSCHPIWDTLRGSDTTYARKRWVLNVAFIKHGHLWLGRYISQFHIWLRRVLFGSQNTH